MAVLPGWYQNSVTTKFEWWDGAQWILDKPRTEDELLRGVAVFSIRPGDGSSITVYENEAWMFPAEGRGLPVGGSIAGARAEVLVQNQVGARTWKGSSMLQVRAKTFEFTFALSKSQSKRPAELARLNQIADFINNRSIATSSLAAEVHGQAETPAVPSASIADELTKLAGLRSQGILTDDEFQAAKARLLS